MNIPSLSDLALIFDKVGMSFLVIAFIGFCIWTIGKKVTVWIEVAFTTFKEFLSDMQSSLKDISISNRDMATKIDDMHKILFYKEFLKKRPDDDNNIKDIGVKDGVELDVTSK